MRRILCPECAAEWPKKQCAEDTPMGFRMRRVEIPHVKKPADLGVTINGVFCEPATLQCDSCCAPLPDGSPAVAITQWRTGYDMGPWEREYSQD